jgi:hypothetical protein
LRVCCVNSKSMQAGVTPALPATYLQGFSPKWGVRNGETGTERVLRPVRLYIKRPIDKLDVHVPHPLSGVGVSGGSGSVGMTGGGLDSAGGKTTFGK